MIINLTQHPATAEQVAEGVVDLAGEELAALKNALTFDAIPSLEEIRERAEFIAALAVVNNLNGDEADSPCPASAMIGGAPYLMGALERELIEQGIMPIYAFTAREVVETTEQDGSVKKTAVFRHKVFVGVQV